MQIWDITREMFSAPVYPGDEKPFSEKVVSMEKGALYNLTRLRMEAHNGTHLDAPCHFIEDGDSIEKMELSRTLGPCRVVRMQGEIGKETAEKLMQTGAQRLLIAGDVLILEEAAKVFAQSGLLLLGVEGLTVGPLHAPLRVHTLLLREKVAILENLDLGSVQQGEYMLSALPLKLAGSDGAPCRAVLFRE